MAERREVNESVRIKFDAKNVPLMRQVGDAMGVKIVTLLEEGQDYTATSGYSGVVEKGKIYVEVQRLGEHGDLSRFWDEVNKLISEAGEVPSK